jgi:hypothetical protein
LARAHAFSATCPKCFARQFVHLMLLLLNVIKANYYWDKIWWTRKSKIGALQNIKSHKWCSGVERQCQASVFYIVLWTETNRTHLFSHNFFFVLSKSNLFIVSSDKGEIFEHICD